MRTTLAALAALTFAAAALAAPKPTPTRTPAPAPTPKRTAPPRRVATSSVTITAVGPYRLSYGDRLDIHGRGLKRVTAVIVGRFAAEILEQTDELIGIRMPYDPATQSYEVYPLIVVPGEIVLNTGTNVIASANEVIETPKPVGRILLDEKTEVAAAAPKPLEFEAPAGGSIDVELVVTGGEVEASLQRADGAADPLVRATYGGKLDWELRLRPLEKTGDKGPLKLVLSLATDAKGTVSVQAKITESARKAEGGAPRRTPHAR